MTSAHLDRGMHCIKVMLLCFNGIFATTGMLAISIGTTILGVFNHFDPILEDRFYAPPMLLVVTGIIIFIVALFGCFGAIKESTCMIMTFSMMLAAIFVLEFAASIAAYFLQFNMEDVVNGYLWKAEKKYQSDGVVAEAMDLIQSWLPCCGVNNYTDWAGVLNPFNRSYVQFDNVTLPLSCCPTTEYNSSVWYNSTLPSCSVAPPDGCEGVFAYVVGESALLLAAAAVCMAFLQILGVGFACALGRSIRQEKTARERRRYELREQLANSYSPLHRGALSAAYPVTYTAKSSTA